MGRSPMSEPRDGDELAQLRTADPVSRVALPSPRGPQAEALFQAIVRDELTSADQPHLRRPALLVAAGIVVIALAAGAVLTLTRNTPDRPNTEVAVRPTPTEAAPGISPGPISPGGPLVGSC